MPNPKLYCNIAAIDKGLDPVGNARNFEDTLVLEVPLPWKKDIYSTAGALPQEVIDLMKVWLDRYRAGEPYSHGMLMVAQDEKYSVEGHRRVLFYRRSAPMMAAYERVEYLVPTDRMGALAWALYEAPETLEQFALYRVENSPTRDLMVCTHGTVDAACAKFGYPLYNHLRKNHDSGDLRVWRVSHFGGHVFAPTLVEMPTGQFWAYVEEAQADAIAQRSGDPRDLYGHYRGLASIGDHFLQAFERELWMQHGFAWFGYCKAGRTLETEQTEEPTWAEVEIRYESPDGRISGTAQARVEITKRIPVIYATGGKDEYNYEQYTVTAIREKAAV